MLNVNLSHKIIEYPNDNGAEMIVQLLALDVDVWWVHLKVIKASHRMPDGATIKNAVLIPDRIALVTRHIRTRSTTSDFMISF